LREIIFNDFCGKFIFDTVSLLVGVSSHLVVILVLNLYFLESLGWLSRDRVADLVDCPGEVTSALSNFLELDLHDTSRNSAFNFFKSFNRFAVEVVLRRRSYFCRKLVAEFVFIFEWNLSLDRELVLVQLTISLVTRPRAEGTQLSRNGHFSSHVEAFIDNRNLVSVSCDGKGASLLESTGVLHTLDFDDGLLISGDGDRHENPELIFLSVRSRARPLTADTSAHCGLNH
jgi:hypothetical protein